MNESTDTDTNTDSDRQGESPGSIDGISDFMGMSWDDPQTVRLQIRPELINAGGLLSGVVTYALVDYCMGSTLWVQTTAEERIATISISINYIQTATVGELVCSTTLDRRNRSTAVMRSEVRHEDGRLLVTAIGSYAIFTRRPRSASPTAPRPA
jgi:1,4-dihydroxy-2-naphthoyl-CoA hydrolase